jgi:AbrB family transcriptional regulator (stage V sporulation protein T)
MVVHGITGKILWILSFARFISLTKGVFDMKATGIVRRIDDLGRVVIPKEIRRTMRIREGDPLEIYTSRDGEVIFKKYSLLGGVEDFASQLCETMSRSTGTICAVTDRDTVIAVAGGGKRELMGKRITAELEQIMESRRIYQYGGEGNSLPVSDSSEKLVTLVAAPILSEGDVLGLVLVIGSAPGGAAGDAEFKLAQTIAAFLGRHMEN